MDEFESRESAAALPEMHEQSSLPDDRIDIGGGVLWVAEATPTSFGFSGARLERAIQNLVTPILTADRVIRPAASRVSPER
jgi:hypothetical protein